MPSLKNPSNSSAQVISLLFLAPSPREFLRPSGRRNKPDRPVEGSRRACFRSSYPSSSLASPPSSFCASWRLPVPLTVCRLTPPTRPFYCHSTGLVRQSLSPKIVPQNFFQMHQWEQSWRKGEWKERLCVGQRMFRGHNTDTGLIFKGFLFSPTTGYRWFSRRTVGQRP